MPKVKLTQVRSGIGQNPRNRGTLRALGLGRIGKTREHDTGPVLAGMLRKVRHLVKVEDVCRARQDQTDELNLSNLKPEDKRFSEKRGNNSCCYCPRKSSGKT